MLMLPPLTSATNIQFALMKLQEQLRAVHDAADKFAPEGTPEIWNAIESLNGAMRDVHPYADKEHQAWLEAEYKRQQGGK